MAALGLSLYQLARRREARALADLPARPAGRLIWLHAPEADQTPPLAELARRIHDEDGHPVLLTAPAPPYPLPPGTIWQALPPADTPETARALLDHWLPDCILFAGGELRPALKQAAHARRIAMAMVEARAPHLPDGRDGWYPGLIRASLAPLRAVFALDEPALKALRKAGAPGLALTGRMEQPSAVLPGNEAERAALAALMNSRPVWLAVDVPPGEEAAVIAAHRAALGHAHRLLLILLPATPTDNPALAARLEQTEGWRVAQRAADEDPEPETQVLIADTSELGLWYRLAPIAFLGGSLAGTGCLPDPMQAAALGASVIHGPRPGAFGTVLGRLGAARAARSVASATDLAEALAELLSPDRAAKLAQAAWAVASEGVEVTARAHLLIRQMMGED